MKSRYNVISATISAVVLFLLLIDWRGYEAAWDVFGVKAMEKPFGDTRVITHGAESYAAGLDPLVKNPGDPWGRRMNYPRVWQLLYPLGINNTHTEAMAVIIIASFWIGVCLILPRATNQTLAVVFAAAISPAALLGMERGNVDLFLFFLAAFAVWAIQRSSRLACGALLAGFILKLFPLFSWVLLLKLDQPKFKRTALILSGLGGLYLLVTFADVLRVIDGTPRATFFSYGMNICWMAFAITDPALGANLQVLSWILVILTFVWAFSALLRSRPVPEITGEPMQLDGFRAGAGVFVGTFLIGNNWDYRLIFLILALPQILSWTKGTGSRRIIAWMALISLLLSFWHMLLLKLVFGYEDNYEIGFLLDELANWIAFACLTYLLFDSVPGWVRETVRGLRPGKTSRI